ncbi:DNA-binding transcriptional LysR family regulator [Sphingobium sp. B2D3A]|uniref:LysR family transcriptional regulator n=1 Tax=unclassified Sphingobium TaxID=2611147 RepID=UPI00222459B8|nr:MULTISPECIES: LysR family transcriptional regulator [unclassified Sphingobium]MCW2338619.1 DNA-binding transcriptional LysR family regulator [Sphingobium sp. B2D3A]MCW2385077.1 DNA-binding transcriptional LysR family regulator [Sphingobium sp. B2D3D]
MAFTIRQLEIFVEAAKDENFRITADRLGISQPSISNHIKALEQKAGARLFDRQRGSTARLSALGRDLLDQARLLLREANKVQLGATAGSAQSYVLRVAAGPYLIDQWIRPCLPDYYARGQVPNVELILSAPGEEMLSMLRSGKVDVAFFTGRPPVAPDLTIETLRRVTSSLFGTSALVEAVGSDPARISAAPMIMMPDNTPHNDWLINALADACIYPSNVVARPQFTDVAMGLALNGTGLAMLFDEEAAPATTRGQLHRVPVDFEPGYRLMLSRKGFDDARGRLAIDHLRRTLQAGRAAN